MQQITFSSDVPVKLLLTGCLAFKKLVETLHETPKQHSGHQSGRLCLQAAWKGMEQLADEGLVLSIGLQDADVDDVSAVMEYARITPAVNSLEVHPGNRNDALLAFCTSQVTRLACLPLSRARISRDVA